VAFVYSLYSLVKERRTEIEEVEEKNLIPSKAACTPRFRPCVASKALAVAADDGGLVVFILAGGDFQTAPFPAPAFE
jgi:hypothetical protein